MPDLEKKLAEKTAVIGIVGLGYVGLPLAVSFAESGCRVIGFDVKQQRVDWVNEGRSYIVDVDSERLLREDRTRLIGHIINLSDRVMQGALIETKINKSKTSGNARPNRPGYSPQVTINNPSSVSVNEPKSK